MCKLLAFIVYAGITLGFAATIDVHRPDLGHGRVLLLGLGWPLWAGDALGHYALAPYPGEQGLGR